MPKNSTIVFHCRSRCCGSSTVWRGAAGGRCKDRVHICLSLSGQSQIDFVNGTLTLAHVGRERYLPEAGQSGCALYATAPPKCGEEWHANAVSALANCRSPARCDNCK